MWQHMLLKDPQLKALDDSFIVGLRQLLADVQRSIGLQVVWKDAEAAAWSDQPKSLITHTSAHCRAVKKDPLSLAECLHQDNFHAHAWLADANPRLRTCPFGVRELLVPVMVGGTYHGCLFIGPWRGGKPDVLRSTHQLLPSFPGEAMAHACGRLVLSGLLPLLAARTAEAARRQAAAHGDQLIERAIEVIGQRLRSSLRAAEIAAAVSLSTSRFLHRFRTATGETFHGHVSRRLMTEAARRLAHPEARVLDVALDLGFASPAYFATAFRRIHGRAPSAFRQTLRQADA